MFDFCDLGFRAGRIRDVSGFKLPEAWGRFMGLKVYFPKMRGFLTGIIWDFVGVKQDILYLSRCKGLSHMRVSV